MANKRFPVSMNEELLEKVDKMCEEMSTSRNGFINFVVASYIKSENQIYDIVQELFDKKIKELLEQGENAKNVVNKN